MLGLGKVTSGVTYGALIDVGSGSVGVAIVASDDKKPKPEIIYTNRTYMSRGKGKQTKTDNVRRMREALFTATLKLTEEGLRTLSTDHPHARITRILVTCSSPWSHSVTRNLNFENEEGFRISPELIADLVSSAEKQVEEDFKEREITQSLGLVVVERATIDVRVNGYQIHNAEGQNATQLTLAHTTGMIPHDVLDAVHEVQEKILPDTELSSHSYMLVLYCVLRDLFPETKTYTIIDVTGESTEIGIVEDSVLRLTAHAGCGSNTLIRELAEHFNTTDDDAISQLNLEIQKVGPGETTERLDELMAPFDNAFHETLEHMDSYAPISKTIVVTALPELEAVFAARMPYLAKKELGQDAHAIGLHPAILKEIVQSIESDVFIAVAARFFHKLHGCGEIESA